MPSKKKRVPIPEDLSDEILYLSDRTCCKCRVPKKPVQIHHIDEDPSNNDPLNLAVLCLECHDETQVSGGFGRKLTAGQVRRYRDAWLQQVAETRRSQHAAQILISIVQQAGMATEAPQQYEEVMREIRRTEAESLLLQADKMATSLVEKDGLVDKAVAIYPDYKQREFRQLGIEMAQAVLGNVDSLQWQYIQATRYNPEAYISPEPLDADKRTLFIESAIKYLTETVVQATDEDAVGLVYLACMYGIAQRYDDMMRTLDTARQISPIVQVMNDQFRKRPMMFMLVDACEGNPGKITRLRETLALPEPTEQYFCTYIMQEYPLTTTYQNGNYSEWVAVTRPNARGATETSSTFLRIALVYPPEKRNTYAFFMSPSGRIEQIIPADKQVSVEDLYLKLRDLCILFCPLD